MKQTKAITRLGRQQSANGCSVHTQKACARDLAAFTQWLKLTRPSVAGENTVVTVEHSPCVRVRNQGGPVSWRGVSLEGTGGGVDCLGVAMPPTSAAISPTRDPKNPN